MSTEIEDRLTAALGARAEQVTTADLPALVVPEATVVPFLRRPVVWGLAAAACIALAVPFAVNNHDRHTDNISPAPSPTSDPTPGATLTGDLDGDGTNETVSIDEHGTLSVVLASSNSGTPLTADAGADGSTLGGVVYLDDSDAQSVVTDDRGTGRIFRVTAEGLVQVEVVDGKFFYPFTNSDPESTWTILNRGLLTVTDTPDKAVFDAQAWRLDNRGLLTGDYVGEICSGTDSETFAYCGGGSGVLSDLRQVALFPEAQPLGAGESFQGGVYEGSATVSLNGNVLSIRIGTNQAHTFDLGPGQDRKLYSATLSGEADTTAVVVSEQDAAGTRFRVIGWQAGELAEFGPSPESVPAVDQVSWVSVTGHLFTRHHNGDDQVVVEDWTLTTDGRLVSHELSAANGMPSICFDPPAYDGC
jgi:hypothetical protein